MLPLRFYVRTVTLHHGRFSPAVRRRKRKWRSRSLRYGGTFVRCWTFSLRFCVSLPRWLGSVVPLDTVAGRCSHCVCISFHFLRYVIILRYAVWDPYTPASDVVLVVAHRYVYVASLLTCTHVSTTRFHRWTPLCDPFVSHFAQSASYATPDLHHLPDAVLPHRFGSLPVCARSAASRLDAHTHSRFRSLFSAFSCVSHLFFFCLHYIFVCVCRFASHSRTFAPLGTSVRTAYSLVPPLSHCLFRLPEHCASWISFIAHSVCCLTPLFWASFLVLPPFAIFAFVLSIACAVPRALRAGRAAHGFLAAAHRAWHCRLIPQRSHHRAVSGSPSHRLCRGARWINGCAAIVLLCCIAYHAGITHIMPRGLSALHSRADLRFRVASRGLSCTVPAFSCTHAPLSHCTPLAILPHHYKRLLCTPHTLFYLCTLALAFGRGFLRTSLHLLIRFASRARTGFAHHSFSLLRFPLLVSASFRILR